MGGGNPAQLHMDQEQPVSADFKGGAGGRIKVSFNLEITKADGSVEVRPVTGYLPEQVQEDLNG